MTPAETREGIEAEAGRVCAAQREANRGRGHRRIARIIEARAGPVDAGPRTPLPGKGESAARGILGKILNAHIIARAHPDADDPRPRQRTERAEIVVVAVQHDPAVARHDARQVVEGPLHIREIAEDVGVVEFKIIEHRDVGGVVDELAALVEERAVVFVALDD